MTGALIEKTLQLHFRLELLQGGGDTSSQPWRLDHSNVNKNTETEKNSGVSDSNNDCKGEWEVGLHDTKY
jgi:hypothetical protein